MMNPIIIVAIVAVMLAAIIVGLTLYDKTTPTIQLPCLGEGSVESEGEDGWGDSYSYPILEKSYSYDLWSRNLEIRSCRVIVNGLTPAIYRSFQPHPPYL